MFFNLFQFGSIATHTQYHADIGAVDKCGGTTFTDKRQRLPGDRCQSYCYHHVKYGLRYKQQRNSYDEEGRKRSVALLRYTPDSYQQADVEEYDESPAYQSQFFHNNGKDKVRECLAQEVALY